MATVAGAPVGPMLDLAQELQTGRYRPTAPQVISIAKANGGQREICVFSIRDRVAQRALLQVLQARTDPQMSPCSFGYRPGRSVAGALAKVRTFLNSGFPWVLDADVENCFASIPRDLLLGEVSRRLGSPEASELVAECMGWDTAATQSTVGIPQGAVLSPWLCNIYLWKLDDAMQREHAAMVRFADDFVLLCAAQDRAEGLRERCAQVMEMMRLRLHPLKTAIVHGSRPFRFLGQWLSTTPLLPFSPAVAGGPN